MKKRRLLGVIKNGGVCALRGECSTCAANAVCTQISQDTSRKAARLCGDKRWQELFKTGTIHAYIKLYGKDTDLMELLI